MEAFEPYLHYLHEFTERRRVNVYFKNHQSIFYGAQVSFVNTGRGNLTFARRDLVTTGRLPLMVARVYDSSGEGSQEFGGGWELSAAETIEVHGNTARLHSETGAVIAFLRRGSNFVLAQDYPSDYAGLTALSDGRLALRLRTGHTKEFKSLGGIYRLTRVTDRNGNEARLMYEGNKLKRLESSGHFIELVRGENNRIVETRDERGRHVRYRYDHDGMLAAVVDAGGNTWRYQYTGHGRLHSASDPQGRENFRTWYGADGRVRALDLPSGRVSFDYEQRSRSTTVTSRKALVSRFFHNEEGVTTRVVNPLGQETRITLDGGRNVSELWEDGRLLQEMEYDGEHRVLLRGSYSGENETTARYSYDASSGDLTRIEESDGEVVELGYDGNGNLVRVADEEGVRTYAYSAMGDVVGVGGAHDLQFQVNADGQVTSMLEDGALRTTFGYDAESKLAEVDFSDGLTARMRYDALGLRRDLKYSDGRRVEYTYDPAGNLVRIGVHKLDGTLGGQVLELDESYQVRRQLMADGREVRLDYDRHGNLVESQEGERVLRFEYDSLDRLTLVVTPSGQRLEYHYAPGEPSLVTQHGSYAEAVVTPRRDSGLTFSASWEVFATRADWSQYGSVRFDEKLGRFQLSGPSGYEISTRAGEGEGPLARLRLVDDGTPLHERQRQFQAPSNPMYLPAEYAAINCCPICAYGPDHPPCEPCYEDPPPPPPDPIPSISNIAPVQGAIGTTVSVTIDGASFTTSATVNAGAGITVTYDSRTTTQIKAKFVIASNAAAGNREVRVTTAGGTSNPVTFSVVCAVPTNFQQTNTFDAGNGNLHFDYAWGSNTGNLAHLSACFVGEIVTYPTVANPWPLPSPPFPSGSVMNPTIIDVPGADGGFSDNHGLPSTNFVQPYSNSSFTATQYYRYRCPCSNSGNYVNLLGPLSIVRSVSQNPNGSWKYNIAKPTGGSATINPLP